MKTIVSIPGMHCASCATLIQDVTGDFSDVKNVEVDLDAKTVTLEHDESFSIADWTKAIEELGDAYKVHLLA